MLPEDLERAKTFWVMEGQKSFSKKLTSKQFVKLNPQIDDRGVIVVVGRTGRWMQAT